MVGAALRETSDHVIWGAVALAAAGVLALAFVHQRGQRDERRADSIAPSLELPLVDGSGKQSIEKGRVTVTPFLDLVYVKNTGVSYGLFVQDSHLGQWLLAGFAALAVLAMTIWLARGIDDKLVASSLGLIMGGAASNAVDRLILGGVADFFSLHAFDFYWYVFNLADVAIVAGVAGLLYDSFGPSRNDASKAI